MANIMASVDQRTQLAGKNRMELLLFQLNAKQMYGINVFKVREVTRFPKITVLPQRHPSMIGITELRGIAMPVLDLNRVINHHPLPTPEQSFVIISEYNMTTQAVAVRMVDKIINIGWNEVHAPPIGSRGAGGSYLTAITNYQDLIIEILDVEKILAEIVPRETEISSETLEDDVLKKIGQFEVLVVDDSSVARKQIKNVLLQLGADVITATNGREALDMLQRWAEAGEHVAHKLMMMISDIEMPEMDGYTLTSHVRADPKLNELYIMLHTSLTGTFNETLVEKVGANEFISKFQPDILAEAIKKRMREWVSNTGSRSSGIDDLIANIQRHG